MKYLIIKKNQLHIFLFFVVIAFMLLACGSEKKKSKSVKKHIKKLGTYELQINSDGQFNAFISTQEIKKPLLNFNPKDTIGKLWNIKIKTEKNWKIDSSFYVKNLGEFKRHINGIFGKIPYEKPKNCNYEFKENKFVPKEATAGNQIDTAKLNKLVFTEIKRKSEELNINYETCYRKPSYFLKDKAAKDGLENLKKCLASEISYKLTNTDLKVTKKEFAEWLTLDSNMRVDIIDNKATKFIQKIASENDVIEKSVTFTTTAGIQKTIYAVELGTRIDIYRELNKLKKDIVEGKKVEREPVYGMKGIPEGAFDSNKNYVEVSISEQKLWFYKNGQLLTESPVVTGCPRRGHSTPPGAFYVKYKERNAVLDGPGYSSRVSYWMPFNKGVGLHDARWRRKFGGEIYIGDGSHGCVNLPAATAQLLFEHIQPGSIVLCY
jgi:hypothetical protein